MMKRVDRIKLTFCSESKEGHTILESLSTEPASISVLKCTCQEDTRWLCSKAGANGSGAEGGGAGRIGLNTKSAWIRPNYSKKHFRTLSEGRRMHRTRRVVQDYRTQKGSGFEPCLEDV